MCFNAALVQSAEIIEELYGAAYPQEKFDTPAYFKSAFEHPVWPILKQGRIDAFEPALWGLVPSWTRTAEDAGSIRDKTLNARYETIEIRPSYRHLVDRRRCCVLVDGFVEWRGHGGKKYPYHIALPEKHPFMLAGLWDRWEDPGSDTAFDSFTVITVGAEGLPAQIHNTKLRMPLILGKSSGTAWLEDDRSCRDCAPEITPLFKPLVAWPVSREVSMPGALKNLPEIQNRYEYPELPDLLPV